MKRQSSAGALNKYNRIFKANDDQKEAALIVDTDLRTSDVYALIKARETNELSESEQSPVTKIRRKKKERSSPLKVNAANTSRQSS